MLVYTYTDDFGDTRIGTGKCDEGGLFDERAATAHPDGWLLKRGGYPARGKRATARIKAASEAAAVRWVAEGVLP